ncbi:MAG: L-rhamnose mutarotase [Chloroflexi bacterium]|nr:L-rhamnose mutarotase [Chloroflexota bacterium]
MRRVGFQMKVRHEVIPEYTEWHRKVWPEMLDALRRHGWGNYTLFMRPDGLMFGYVEVAESFQKALDGMAGEEINAKWQELMAPYFEIPEGSFADQNMIELEEVFHLD